MMTAAFLYSVSSNNRTPKENTNPNFVLIHSHITHQTRFILQARPLLFSLKQKISAMNVHVYKAEKKIKNCSLFLRTKETRTKFYFLEKNNLCSRLFFKRRKFLFNHASGVVLEVWLPKHVFILNKCTRT